MIITKVGMRIRFTKKYSTPTRMIELVTVFPAPNNGLPPYVTFKSDNTCVVCQIKWNTILTTKKVPSNMDTPLSRLSDANGGSDRGAKGEDDGIWALQLLKGVSMLLGTFFVVNIVFHFIWHTTQVLSDLKVTYGIT